MIRIRGTRPSVVNMRTRMPFRYGIATMTALPHVILQLEVDIDGERHLGVAADHLPPKWFTKDPDTTYAQDLEDLVAVIEAACAHGRQADPADTVFALWWEIHRRQEAWGRQVGLPPLLWQFGATLVERALIDARCRSAGMPFGDAIRGSELGLRLGDVHEQLAGRSPGDLLPVRPRRRLAVRHTVGISDPLTDAQVPQAERLDDGLPQSLAACIRAYGLTHFKIKLSGDAAADQQRLRDVAGVIREHAGELFAFTLDGNEQYASVAGLRAAWDRLRSDGVLAPFQSHLLFLEQPFHRDRALGETVARELRDWRDRPPIIIDESDGELASLTEALTAGYAGTSHKNCKGVFKGVANACLLEARRREGLSSVLSVEDLSNVGPVALLQDVAVAATLGVDHVERNGHHYFRGLSMFGASVQSAVAAAHPDLYRRHERGFATVRVRQGTIDAGSVVDAPFGVGFEPDLAEMTPLDRWDVSSLDDAPTTGSGRRRAETPGRGFLTEPKGLP